MTFQSNQSSPARALASPLSLGEEQQAPPNKREGSITLPNGTRKGPRNRINLFEFSRFFFGLGRIVLHPFLDAKAMFKKNGEKNSTQLRVILQKKRTREKLAR
jgi:hypothetical protein